jgi:hypothetical protein
MRNAVLACLAVMVAGCSGASGDVSDTDGGGSTPDVRTDTGSPKDSGGGAKDTGTDSSSIPPDGGNTPEGGTDGGGGTPEAGGGDAGCQGNCITMNMAAFEMFEGDELKSCGCKASSPCISMCSAECKDPSTLTMTSPCGACLLTQENMGKGSSCTVGASIACFTNSACSPFVSCEEKCP